MTKQSNLSSSKFECKFCNKEFVREKTLVVHMCENKRRFTQREDTGPRLGINAYKQFYKSTQSNKERTYEDFETCSYYTAFVKYGWYLHQIRAVDPTAFTAFLLKDNVKLDWWTKDKYYEQYIIAFMKKEAPSDGVARTIKELNRWAVENKEDLSNFFKVASPNKIANMISNGRLSPWFLFNCDQGVSTLANFSESQLQVAFKWIDPDFWSSKFASQSEEVQWIRELLEEFGFNE